MAIAVNDFWKLSVTSGLLSREEAKQLYDAFSRTRGAQNANAPLVAQWLISRGMMTAYQAKQLLAGRSGPFVLGDYKIFDRLTTGPLAGLYRALHDATGQSTLLFLCSPEMTVAGHDWAAQEAMIKALVVGKYPQLGRVFGLAEIDGQRFLVLEDVVDQPAAAAPMPAPAPQAPTPQTRPLRPILAPQRPAAPIAIDQSLPLEMDSPVVMQTGIGELGDLPDQPYVRPRKDNTLMIIASAVGGVGVVLLIALVLFSSGRKAEEPPTPPAAKTEPTAEPSVAESITPTPQPDTPPETEEESPKIAKAPPKEPKPRAIETPPPQAKLINDDGHTLWASPTAGPPIDLHYLASGAQMFLVVRPAALLNHADGPKVFEALGPPGVAGRDWIQTLSGVQLDEIERLLVAFYPPADGGPPQTACVVTLKQASTPQKLLQGWHDPKEAGKDRKFYVGGPWAYYIPPEGNNRVFAIAPPSIMTDMLALEGPPSLRKEMEKLLRDTDDTRQITILVAPNFLFADGEAILSGDLAKLKAPLLAYLDEGVKAAALSFDLSDNFFTELRVFGAIDRTPFDWAEEYRKRLSDMPDQVENYLTELNPHEYGRRILFRMPQMIRLMANYTRIGDENAQAVLRCYLPGAAAHNLVLGTELALAERPGGGAVSVAAAPKKPATVAEALKKKISLSFPRNTLEKCMEMLADEIEFPVHIEGKDLQLDGITKNQSFGLDERDKPAGEILRKVMALANPDGKLVYVLKPAEPGGKDGVFITTRAAVAKRGDKLPPELEQAPPKK